MAAKTEHATKALSGLDASGALSPDTRSALQKVEGAVEKITEGLGAQSEKDELLLALILVDDSASIATRIAEIRLGHSLALKALRSQSFDADVQIQTRALSRGVLSPYNSLANVGPLTEQNYSGSRLAGVTPLYLQSLLTLYTVMVKAQQEEERGVKVRTFTLIITDGVDNNSGAVTATHVQAIVTDMLEFATNHIVAGMGIGESADFRAIFHSLGIPERWIFTPGTSVKELEEVFDMIAKSLCLSASSEIEFARQLAAGPPSRS